MKEKKTAVITFRTEEWVKNALQEIANHNKWSIAQLIHTICLNQVINPHPEEITISTSKFLEIAEEIKSEKENFGAIELSIDLEVNEDETDVFKVLRFMALQCGGYGACGDFDEIKEMTEEELRNIP